jgi:prolyl 4-hydroxylase
VAVILRQGYDVGMQLSDDPVVWVVDGFVTAAESEHVIELGARDLDVAKVSRLGASSESAKRTGSVAWVGHHETALVRALVRRVGDLVGIPSTHAESLQVVHYGVAQEYRPHFDAWDIKTPKGRQKTTRHGNRAVTALMYLNEVEAGGATTFPELDLEVAALPGRLCLFHNLREESAERHPRSLHGGMPVIAGEKWACNLWFRERRTSQGSPRSSRTTPSGTQPAKGRKRR